MPLIHHVVAGQGGTPIVFVHGFACALADWDAQMRHFAPQRRAVAVDLRGHGASPGVPADCAIERYGADVADLLHALDLPPAILVGHSMGCRVVVEAALQAPSRAAGVVMVDGSQFAAAMEPVLRARFATADGFAAQTRQMFQEMFTARSEPAVVAAVVQRAVDLPRAIGERLMLDLLRYDVARWSGALGCLRVPVLVLQSTYSDPQRRRRPMAAGQVSPYLEMVRQALPAAQVEIIAETGHFPQYDESARINAAIAAFAASLP
jgi:pimeloyl-ACP methyl ester carboxylesterase